MTEPGSPHRAWIEIDRALAAEGETRQDRIAVLTRRYAEAVRSWEQVVQVNASSPFAQAARSHARSARDLQHIFAGAA